MILHPGVLSLLVGSLIVIVMMLYSSVLGVRILRKWDINSASMEQLTLERKTYLVSTVMNFVLGFELLSTFLFIYTVDDIHDIFVGAMCATGSLNANPIGWYVLFSKIAIFFLAAAWIALNSIDQRAEDYPLTRLKYAMLLIITPLIFLDSYLIGRYFLGLEPNKITSCCGSLFSESGSNVAAGLSSLPLVPSMLAFYGAISLFVVVALISLRRPAVWLKYALALSAAIVLVVSLSSIISFISLYFYEMPTHHCPFDILQANYYFIGYPVYFTLFGSVLLGLITGMAEPLKKIVSLAPAITTLQKKWTILALLLIFFFVLITTYPIVFSDFSMIGY